MNLVEWGTDFPVSGKIQAVLFSLTHKYKGLKMFIRTLNTILLLYDDSSIVVIPISSLQEKATVESIQSFIEGGKKPDELLYIENKFQVVDIFSLKSENDDFPILLIYKENFTFDMIQTSNNKATLIKSNEPMKIFASHLRRVFINNGLITIVTQKDDEQKYTIYSAMYSASHKENSWAMQCETETLPTYIYASPPSLIFLNQNGMFGCSLDSKGYRKFPRPLIPIVESPQILYVKSVDDFYYYNKNDSTLYKIIGKRHKKICCLKVDNLLDIAVFRSRIFCTTDSSIHVYDIITNQEIQTFQVTKLSSVKEWKISLEDSYGIVFVGEKNYTISKTEIPPLINIYADKNDLMQQMKKVQDRIGTIAAPIVLISNRSSFLAATLLSDEIKDEVSKPAPKGSLQAIVKPTLEKLNQLIQEKPDFV